MQRLIRQRLNPLIYARGSYSLEGRWLRLSAVRGQKLTLSDADGQVLLRFETVYLR